MISFRNKGMLPYFLGLGLQNAGNLILSKVLCNIRLKEQTMSDTPEIKASVIYVCGLNPNPVVELERLTSVKNSQGSYMPAIRTLAMVQNGQEYAVKFPVFSFDISSEEQFEETRKLFHQRIDRTFDEYRTRWEKTKEQAAERSAKAKTIREVVAEKKASQESLGSAPERTEDGD